MRMPGVCICSHAYKLNKKGCFLSHQRSHHFSHKRDKETFFPIFVGLKFHAETRKRRTVDALFTFGVFVWAFPTQVLTIWPEHCYANKHAKKEKKKSTFTTAAVDNIDPSPTTANVSFHGTSVSLARQMENEGEKRVLSGSVDTSTRK